MFFAMDVCSALVYGGEQGCLPLTGTYSQFPVAYTEVAMLSIHTTGDTISTAGCCLSCLIDLMASTLAPPGLFSTVVGDAPKG